jgi:hypothetical protein
VNGLLLAASALAVIIAVTRSVLGEHLIFRHLRTQRIVPTRPAPPLSERHVRIIWATWHLASVVALGFAGILWAMSWSGERDPVMLWSITAAFAASGALVLVATRGRHPGWIALSGVAVLVALAALP